MSFPLLAYRSTYFSLAQEASHGQSINCSSTNYWVAFQLDSVLVYYGALKSIIVAQSDG